MTKSSSLAEGAPMSSISALGSTNGTDIRPVIYVVNATVGVGNEHNDAGPDEPGSLQSRHSGEQENSLYKSFLTSLQCNTTSTDESTTSGRSSVGRWRQEHGSGAEIHIPSDNYIANDIDNDNDGTTTAAAAAADPTYSKDNPQVNFMSRRARVISVNRRHAFPPSKCPHGKMNGMTSMIGETQGSLGNSWLSSYNVQYEGILPTGWIEKHRNVLPSALVVVTTINEASINNCIVDRHIIQAVEDFRMTLAEKRSVPIHLACLTNCVGGSQNSNRVRDQRVAILKEKICEECYLPQSQVFLLNYPKDLEPDEFENAVLRSPYRSGTQDTPNDAGAKPAIMNPHLRQLDRSLRDSSALYYSRLAEAQERKLSLWRNRYHSSNSSFEVNTLIAGIRCARYALKVATLREFQMRTGATSSWSSVDDGGAKWSDKGSLCMRFYEEAYRWVIEMHRRAVTWRATSNNSGSDLMTPRSNVSSNHGMSPNITQSPGGGIGVELPLPSFRPDVPEPPMEIDSPTTPKKGSEVVKDIVLYANLWQQCRAVASLINAKLLCTSNPSNCQDTVNQWKRHRLIFLASPQGIRDYDPSQHDAFFGHAWYRMRFATEELRIYACAVEVQLCRGMLLSSKNGTTMPKPSYHQIAAPWKIYSELAEAIMGLGAEIKRQKKESSVTSDMDDESFGNFVGSNAAGEARLRNELQRDHKGIALEYILHALDLFEEAKTSAEPLISIGGAEVSSASVRLHYLAGRLLMSIDNPIGGAVHLKLAAERTKKWPSLQLLIQRALLACEERCLVIDDEPSSKSARAEKSKISCAKLLFEPESCALLTDKEIKQAQSKAWGVGCKEIVWKGDSCGDSRPPFDFALSFLKSTHATSGDSVLACLSIKTQVDFQLCAKTIKLFTSVGNFNVSTSDLCFNKAQLHSWLKSSSPASGHSQLNSSEGVHFTPNEVAYILTEISLPSDFSSVALGGTAIGNNFYTPKSGKITNMGMTHAAGNVCESLQEKVAPTGKPVPITSLPESTTSFLGGIPFVCHGVEMELGSLGGNTSAPSTPSLKLRVEKSLLLSPLGRSGNQLLQMEECGYMAHAWSRPGHQHWCLGPRCLRILGPRPQMDITNLTDSHTNGIAIEGTVNRIIFKLQAGTDVDCRGVRLSIRCRNSSGALLSEVEDDVASEGVTNNVELDRRPFFVKRSTNDNTSVADEENDTSLPKGWEPRNDVFTDESNMSSSVIAPHIEAGKSMLLPLDLFRPLNQTGDSSECDSCTTSYEITITYRQVRTINGVSQSSDLGDQVVVVRSGTVTWISPFTAEFSPINGTQKSFPCGIKHASNMVQPASNDPSNSSALIAADGERIRMRCHLKAKELGNKVAANIEYVVNENETAEEQKYLYSSADSNLFFAQSKQGSKLSLSYSITAKTSANVSGAMSLGAVSLGWKPVGLTLSSEMTYTDANCSMLADFGLAHGPLILSNIAPMKFYGPRCHVLDAPFKAKVLKCPSAPKVGTPFRVSYQVTNLTAKSQTLKLSLNNNQSGGTAPTSNSQLLVTGKMQGETQMAPWEEKVFSFTFMSMIAGKVPRPQLSVSSGRHKTWVINESNNLSSPTFFVMP